MRSTWKDLKHIYLELNNKDVMAGINTGNITECRAFTDLAEQIGNIRDRVIHPE